MLHIFNECLRLGKVEVAASSVRIRPEVDEWQSVDSWSLTLVGAKALLEPHYEVDYRKEICWQVHPPGKTTWNPTARQAVR